MFYDHCWVRLIQNIWAWVLCPFAWARLAERQTCKAVNNQSINKFISGSWPINRQTDRQTDKQRQTGNYKNYTKYNYKNEKW